MEIVEAKTKVSIAYTLKEMSGRILEEIPPSHPFVYIHGYDNIIPGLETALEGRKLGEKFTVEIPFDQGYGPYRDELLLQVPKEELQDVGGTLMPSSTVVYKSVADLGPMTVALTFEEAAAKYVAEGAPVDLVYPREGLVSDQDGIYIVKEIYKDTVLVDGNHPFAGKDLIFEVQVVNIEEPSFTELESGFPDRDDNYDDGDYPENYDDRYDDFDGPDNHRRWR